MAVSLTVPSQSKTLPAQPVAKNQAGTETNSAALEKARKTAESKLRQRNPKGNEFIIEFPILTTMESGTVYKLSGFTPDADATQWTLIDVVMSFKGKGGSTTKCTFQKSLEYPEKETASTPAAESGTANAPPSNSAPQLVHHPDGRITLFYNDKSLIRFFI
jgi:hypothetical protein